MPKQQMFYILIKKSQIFFVISSIIIMHRKIFVHLIIAPMNILELWCNNEK